MNQHSVAFRPASPTNDEGKAFASYMDSASEGGLKLIFGKRFEEIVSRVYLEPYHDLSYQTALFAELDGKIVGMVSGYTAEQHRQFSKDVVSKFAGRSSFRISLFYKLLSRMMRFLHTYNAGDFYVEFLAVDADCRGQGVGFTLMQAIEDRARECGATQLAIDVARRNQSARRLYERIGFRQIDHWPKTVLIRPNILRLSKAL